MMRVAVQTDRGTTNPVNQDACCALVASTPLGELALGIVCDGVGGLSLGELASSTVVNRFLRWFEDELPTLMGSMVEAGAFDFDLIEAVWRAQLDGLNGLIQAHGAQAGGLGTTFTGVIVCEGRFLAGHVGDCRLYRIGASGIEQVSEDQTLLAHKLAQGELTPEEARTSPERHVIMQAVGTERMLRPSFYRGELSANDLLVICCDGAYQKAEDGALARIFAEADSADASSLERACRRLIDFDIAQGETDNLTVVCLGVGAGGAADRENAAPAAGEGVDTIPTTVAGSVMRSTGTDAVPTTVADPDATPTAVVGTALGAADLGTPPTAREERGDA